MQSPRSSRTGVRPQDEGSGREEGRKRGIWQDQPGCVTPGGKHLSFPTRVPGSQVRAVAAHAGNSRRRPGSKSQLRSPWPLVPEKADLQIPTSPARRVWGDQAFRPLEPIRREQDWAQGRVPVQLPTRPQEAQPGSRHVQKERAGGGSRPAEHLGAAPGEPHGLGKGCRSQQGSPSPSPRADVATLPWRPGSRLCHRLGTARSQHRAELSRGNQRRPHLLMVPFPSTGNPKGMSKATPGGWDELLPKKASLTVARPVRFRG